MVEQLFTVTDGVKSNEKKRKEQLCSARSEKRGDEETNRARSRG